MGLERTSVGLDVHARSVSAAAIDGVTGELIRQRLVPDTNVVLDWVCGLPGPVAATYEAGPTGFGLAGRSPPPGSAARSPRRRRSTGRRGIG